MKSDREIVDEMISWSVAVAEQPHQAFGDMPVCPYAKKARLDGKIKYKILRYLVKDYNLVMDAIKEFAQEDYEIMVVLNPNEIPLEEHKVFVASLLPEASGIGMEVFGAHPNDDLQIGTWKSQLPFVGLQVLSRELLKDRTAKLLKTRYYDNFTQENFDELRVPDRTKDG